MPRVAQVCEWSGILLYQQLTVATGQLTDAEKKAKKRAKKAAQKTQEDPKKPVNSANEDKGLEAPAPKDDDPDGTKLLASPDGLDTAVKFLQPLVNLELPSVRLWVTVHDVAIRRSKLNVALLSPGALLNYRREVPAGGKSSCPRVHARFWRPGSTRASCRDSQAL